MGTTQNYGYNVPVGSDNVNLLPQMAANFPMIDSDLKAVSNAAIGSATELTTGTVHALTRADTSRNVFVFVATSDYEAGETFEVDGVQVTAKTPDGQNLSSGAYVINSGVLCVLNGTLLTVIVNPAKALDADKLDGHDSSYFATAADLSVLDNQVGAVSSKVGTGVLDVGNDCVDGINTLNTHLTDLGMIVTTSTTGGVRIIKIGHLVLVSGNLPAGSAGATIATGLPAPKIGRVPSFAYNAYHGTFHKIIVETNGSLKLMEATDNDSSFGFAYMEAYTE